MLAMPNIRAAIARAREMQQEAIADELLEIADNAGTGPGEVEKAKLRIWTRQWVAAKLAPKKFGDKLRVEDISEKKQLTREEIQAQLAASGLRVDDIFAAITKRAEPASGDYIELPAPSSSPTPQDGAVGSADDADDDLSGLNSQ